MADILDKGLAERTENKCSPGGERLSGVGLGGAKREINGEVTGSNDDVCFHS